MASYTKKIKQQQQYKLLVGTFLDEPEHRLGPP